MFTIPKLTKDIVYKKKCLARVDYNSSFENGVIKNDFRIKKTLPLINWMRENQAITILLTHIKENDGEIPELARFYNILKNNYIPSGHLFYSKEITGKNIKKTISELKGGDIILLNNLRLDDREEKNDISFSKELSDLGDLYINEAFSNSHRKHSSIVGIPEFLPAYFGFNFIEEIKNLSRVLNPESPLAVFIGGKKINTKEQVIEKLLNKADFIALGGLMAAEFYFAKGFNIGKTNIDIKSSDLIKEKFLNHNKIIIPENFIILRNKQKKDILISEIQENDVIYDISPSFFDKIKNNIKNKSLILWNGPMGYIENGFTEGTTKLAEILFQDNYEVIAGGGETIDFIFSSGLENKFSFISTGGGALLEFIANETLPGIEAIMRQTTLKTATQVLK